MNRLNRTGLITQANFIYKSPESWSQLPSASITQWVSADATTEPLLSAGPSLSSVKTKSGTQRQNRILHPLAGKQKDLPYIWETEE